MTLPVIVVEPEDMVEVRIGSTLTLSVEATGIGLAYLWLRTSGTAVSLVDHPRVDGARTSQMRIREVESADSGGYACEVSNSAGTVRSREATVVVSK